MLAQIIIRDIVLADRLDVSFGRGLNIITGETGAGKSLLSEALSLALGARGRADLVRSGADSGEVTALFDTPLDHPALALLADQGIKVEGALALKRVQFAHGRARAFVNARPVSRRFLRDLGSALVEIHGQGDARGLLEPPSSRAILDVFAGLASEVEAVSEAWRRLGLLREAERVHEKQVADFLQDRDYLRHMLEEFDRLAPQPGEEESLTEQRSVMIREEKVKEQLRGLQNLLDGDDGPLSRLSAMLRGLERQSVQEKHFPIEPIRFLERIVTEMMGLQEWLQDAIGTHCFDSGVLERVEERLFALRALARKHNVPPNDLPTLHETFGTRAALADSVENEREHYAKQVQEAWSHYRALALALSKKRVEAGKALDVAVEAELEPLKLGQVHFVTRVDSRESAQHAHGLDHVSFSARMNPGAKFGPVHEIASGGEASRLLLALRVVLAGCGSAPTLIFDEADLAVGGAVSDAIGQRLAKLSERVQVIAVTHSPQVAARADRHLHVKKLFPGQTAAVGFGSAVTRIDVLDPSGRREEIARMLSGAEVTDEARAQACRLIDAAS